ncbi:ABC-2 transporter permease [Paenibacillus sp. GCM10027626]|uniref:ABC-2 transporter permease n=1 Tax=Paenibacillus sp. GCM10027626 TaxID=3273411 RepID=UPI003626F70A
MLLNLIRKDFLLIKKYIPIMFIIAVVVPFYLNTRAAGTFMEGSFFNFFLTTLYIQYLMFNSVSLAEYKNKGNALLCALPYTRKAFITSKYCFLLIIFIGCLLIYSAVTLLVLGQTAMLSIAQIVLSFSLLSFVFSLLIPAQIHFGYEKSKFIFAVFIVATPFVMPQIIKLLQQNNASMPAAASGLQSFDVLMLVAALVALIVSHQVSNRFYGMKSL